ncbi:zinc-dependent metalloprotease [Flagellimonas sp.]|uniref:zinc-dependent metalloprotease n=1 Tax=Flagellimonas sp. TaxID=2058762 RepID=UPI003BABBB3E
MKYFIWLCFLSMSVLGNASEMSAIAEVVGTLGTNRESGPFLTTFREGDQLYLEIPDQLLDRPILFVCYDGTKRSYMQVAWSLYEDRMFLKQQSIVSTAGIILPLKEGLSLRENVLAILSVEKGHGGTTGHCINITDLILKQDVVWPQKLSGVRFGHPVPEISYVEGLKNGVDEVLFKVRRGMVISDSKVTKPLVYAFCALGEPMQGRRFDYRMGFCNDQFDTGFHFGFKNRLANIGRWRLSKKYPDQKLSVPERPITFLISPEVPKKWRSYVKAGIEEWLPAFESAGFKDALSVLEMDSLDVWQAHSIHSNVVHWSQNKYFRDKEYEDLGATIGSIMDSRSGEILKGDIFLGASERSVSENYFVRASPLDHRAQQFPLPEELVGALYQQMTAHEAGHVFGLLDGNFGEFTYPWEWMNDSVWLADMGHTPSVMNYTWENNIAQPGDSIPPSWLIQRVGPTDRYHIQWGYTEFPEGTTLEEERAALERMVRWQDTVPWYRFNYGQLEVIGPGNTSEVVETNDPVRSTELALKNVKRVIELLPKVAQGQSDNARLERLYGKTVALWDSHMKHVLSLIGGYDIRYKSLDQPGSQYEPIPWEKQMEALDFLLANALEAPSWLTDPEFHDRVKYSSFSDEVLKYQQLLIFDLVVPNRFKRMEQMEIRMDRKGLVQAYLERLQTGLFREAFEGSGEVNPRKQEVQMTYIDALAGHLSKKRSGFSPEARFLVQTDFTKGLLVAQLMVLKQAIEKCIRKNRAASSVGHWELCLKKINMLN